MTAETLLTESTKQGECWENHHIPIPSVRPEGVCTPDNYNIPKADLQMIWESQRVVSIRAIWLLTMYANSEFVTDHGMVLNKLYRSVSERGAVEVSVRVIS